MMAELDEVTRGAIAKALQGLFGDLPARAITRQRAEHVMRALAQTVASEARNQVLLSLLSTETMAEQLGISTRRVRALARARQVGWQVGQGVWIFLPEDIEHLRARRPGRPGRPRSKGAGDAQ